MKHTFGLIPLLLAVGACGGSTEETSYTTTEGSKVEETKDSDGDVQTATITTSGPDGAGSAVVAGAGSRWPENVPDYAAAYPGATVQGSFAGSSAAQTGAMITFTTSDSQQQVIDFYSERAKSAGLKNVSTTEAGTMRTFGASDHDRGRSMSVMTNVENGSTTAVVSYGTSAK